MPAPTDGEFMHQQQYGSADWLLEQRARGLDPTMVLEGFIKTSLEHGWRQEYSDHGPMRWAYDAPARIALQPERTAMRNCLRTGNLALQLALALDPEGAKTDLLMYEQAGNLCESIGSQLETMTYGLPSTPGRLITN